MEKSYQTNNRIKRTYKFFLWKINAKGWVVVNLTVPPPIPVIFIASPAVSARPAAQPPVPFPGSAQRHPPAADATQSTYYIYFIYWLLPFFKKILYFFLSYSRRIYSICFLNFNFLTFLMRWITFLCLPLGHPAHGWTAKLVLRHNVGPESNIAHL